MLLSSCGWTTGYSSQASRQPKPLCTTLSKPPPFTHPLHHLTVHLSLSYQDGRLIVSCSGKSTPSRIDLSFLIQRCNFMYLFIAVLDLLCCTRTFSSCREWRGYSSCGGQVSPYGAFSSCRAWALGARASVVAAFGLSSCGPQALVAPWYVESSQTREWSHVLCIGRQIPIHPTTREVLLVVFELTLMQYKFCM